MKKFLKISKFLLVLVLITGWIFSGFPHISGFPPEIKKAEAAQVTIDDTVSTVGEAHVRTEPATVFISDQTGYKFYRDSNGSVVYKKTTDGGATWGSIVSVDAQTDAIKVAVWYDRWTPGDTTGTFIHIVTMDTSLDDLFYNRLDTADDTLLMGSSPVDAVTNSGNSVAVFTAGSNYPAITKGTDGTIYFAQSDGEDSYVVECTTGCDLTTGWTETGTSPLDLQIHYNLLLPLAGGDIMLLNRAGNIEDLRHKVWNNSSWDAAWTDIDTDAVDNVTYDVGMSAIVDTSNNDIYLAYTADHATLGTDDDIRTAIFSAGSWTLKTNAVTNSSCAGVSDCGLTGVALGFDDNNGDVYVAYSAQTTPGTATTGNVYWKKSTDGMTTWGTESAAVNTTAEDIYGVDLNGPNNERIFVSWANETTDNMYGDTIANLTPSAAPTVTTNFATPGFNTAILHGTKTGGDNATEHGFAYSTNSTLSSGVSTTTLGALNSNSSFSNFITSLSASTQYFFRAYATNGGGTGYGVIKSFTTGNSTATRNLRLFDKLKFIDGRVILYQQ